MKLITQSLIAATAIGLSAAAMAATTGPTCPTVAQLQANATTLVNYHARNFIVDGVSYTAKAWNNVQVNNSYMNPTLFFNPTDPSNEAASLAQAETIIKGINTVSGPYPNSIGPETFEFCVYGGFESSDHFITVNTKPVLAVN